MSDSVPTAKPVSVLSVVGILACFALFLLLVYIAYLPRQSAPFVGDGIRTPAERLAKLAEMRSNEQKHGHSYAWIDQSAGHIQLPLDRAMELTVERYQAKR